MTPPERGLVAAFFASSVLHAALLLVAVLVGAVGEVPVSPRVAPAEPPETRINLTLLPPGAPAGEPRPQPALQLPRRTPLVPPRGEPEGRARAPRLEAPSRSPQSVPVPGVGGGEAPVVPHPPEPLEPQPLDLGRALAKLDEALRSGSGGEPSGTAGAGTPAGFPDGLDLDAPAVAPTGYGVRNLEFTSRDFDWSDYGRQVYVAIWRAWHNRLFLTADEFERWAFRNQNWFLDHHSRIVFTIRRSGEVTDIALVTPSGCTPLDDSATDALAEVVLPPLPDEFPRDAEVVRAVFIATGDIHSMRRDLTRLKQAGWF